MPAAPHRVLLSGVRNPTHVVHAASWLRHRLTAGDRLELDVLDLGSFLGRARVGEADLDRLLPADPHLLRVRPRGEDRWRHPASGRLTLLSVGAPATRAWTRVLAANRGRAPRVVVVDEGLGSYGDARTRLAAYRRQGGSLARSAVRAAVVEGGNRVLTGERWPLYRETTRGWEVNAEVAHEFHRGLAGPAAPANRVVYLSQPWPEIGVLPREAYRAHLREVARRCAAEGADLVLRLHPADDPEAYADLATVEAGGPAELDRTVTTAATVLGTQSTALLNLAAVHGVRALRLEVPGLAGLEEALGARQRSLLRAYLPAPLSVDALPPLLDR